MLQSPHKIRAVIAICPSASLFNPYLFEFLATLNLSYRWHQKLSKIQIGAP